MSRRVARLRRRSKSAPFSVPPPGCGGSTYVFGTGVTEIEGWPGGGVYTQNYEPGSILEITAGSRTRLRISNVQGTAECPITIRNSSGGAVVMTSTSVTNFEIRNCHYIIIDGTGASGVTYGFQATAATSERSMHIRYRSKHLEMFNVEMANSNRIALLVNTKNDTGVDYGGVGPGTPSTFSGPNAYIDEDFNIHHCFWHDGGAEGCYIGNNQARLDNDPDMTGVTMANCTGDTFGLECFDFKAMTGGILIDCDGANSGLDLHQGSMSGCHVDPAGEVVITRHTDTNPTGQNYQMGNAWRAVEVIDCVGIDAGMDSMRLVPPSAQEEDGGTTLVENYTSTNPANSAIDTDVGNAFNAAGSSIQNCELEHGSAYTCIEHDDLSIPESNNVCTPI